MSNVIKVITGIYIGDSLSVIVLVLAFYPLSYLLRSTKGYAYGKNRQHQHTHKSYASDMNTLQRQLEIATTFSKDIGMKFGEEKCTFLQTEKQIKKSPPPIRRIQTGLKSQTALKCRSVYMAIYIEISLRHLSKQ